MECLSQYVINIWIPSEKTMTQKQEVKKQLKKLLRSEEDILYILATNARVDIDEANYAVRKIFEMSNLILRLERTLEEIRKNEN